MEASDRPYARIVFNLPVDRAFDYAITPHLQPQMFVGQRVLAPFGSRKLIGYCVELLGETKIDKVKPLISVLDEVPLVSKKMLELTHWIAEYYCCSWGEALQASIPSSVRGRRRGNTITVVEPLLSSQNLQEQLPRIRKRSPKRARVLEMLDTWEGDAAVQELARAAMCTSSVIKGLQKKGLVRFVQKPAPFDPLSVVSTEREQPLTPTEEQTVALKTISDLVKAGNGGVALIHGVTGSGKTEVYLQTMSSVVKAGHQAIVLVPEISLTPQTVRRFRSRFDRVAVLHSHLTDAERYEQWRAIAEGKADVVVGARSAIFAPTPSLGLIVVDEEHENSFKQDKAPRYHARDVAVVRGMLEKAVVVLGSATPSLESYHNALTGKYHHTELTVRVESRPMPAVEIIDMAREMAEVKGFRYLSRQLENLMHKALDQNEQAILFLNRRGFSTFVTCSRCGFVMKCEHCDIPLTYHQHLDRAICHHCGYESSAEAKCPECATKTIRYYGMGTERIEDEVKRKFLDTPIVRMDSDAMRGRGAHERALSDFSAGKTRIMVGTQMIAKGLDFPNVTIVGVLGADMLLNLPDFRSGERAFQLLTQVSGRTGRGSKGGRVVIQSYVADHYSITCAAEHDYKSFAAQELEHRRQLRYPPYGRLLKFVIHGRNEKQVHRRSLDLAGSLRKVIQGREAQLMGPAPCPITKIRDRYRWQILIKAPQSRAVRTIVREISKEIARKGSTQVVVDVDPVMML